MSEKAYIVLQNQFWGANRQPVWSVEKVRMKYTKKVKTAVGRREMVRL
jgi:hypothetical protein